MTTNEIKSLLKINADADTAKVVISPKDAIYIQGYKNLEVLIHLFLYRYII